jgi:hypothetical protein
MPWDPCFLRGRRRDGWQASRYPYRLLGMPAENGAPSKRRKWSWWYLLFVLQMLVILWPPFYNKIQPTLLGIPFFYWFQLLWVLVSAVFTAVVYFMSRESQ